MPTLYLLWIFGFFMGGLGTFHILKVITLVFFSLGLSCIKKAKPAWSGLGICLAGFVWAWLMHSNWGFCHDFADKIFENPLGGAYQLFEDFAGQRFFCNTKSDSRWSFFQDSIEANTFIPFHLKAWFIALICGQDKNLQISDSFKSLGLYHLIVVSGVHVHYMFGLFSLIFAWPVKVAYIFRLLNPLQNLQILQISRLLIYIGVGIFCASTGFYPPAQRALIFMILLGCNSKDQAATLSNFVKGACIQSLIFPVGFFSASNLLSWASFYSMVVIQGSKLPFPKTSGLFLRALLLQVVLTFVVSIVLGQFYWIGIFFNLLIGPIFSVFFVSGLFLVLNILPSSLADLSLTLHSEFLKWIAITEESLRREIATSIKIENHFVNAMIVLGVIILLVYLQSFRKRLTSYGKIEAVQRSIAGEMSFLTASKNRYTGALLMDKQSAFHPVSKPDTSKFQNRSVVVVDDSKEIRDDLCRTYQELGLKIVGVFPNAIEFLEKYESLKPDVVSLDIIMPQMNGVECFKILKSKYPDISCIFVSFLAHQASLREGLAALINPERFVVKPFDENSISAALNDVFK